MSDQNFVRTNQTKHQSSNISPKSNGGPKKNFCRRVAKTARINLNRYFGMLSRLPHFNEKLIEDEENLDVTYAIEMEQNRINEQLEAFHRISNVENQRTYNQRIIQQNEQDCYCCTSQQSFYLIPSHHQTISSTPQPIPKLISSKQRSRSISSSSGISSSSESIFL